MELHRFLNRHFMSSEDTIPDENTEQYLTEWGYILIRQWGDAAASVSLYERVDKTTKQGDFYETFMAITRLGHQAIAVHAREIFDIMAHLHQPLEFVQQNLNMTSRPAG